LCTCIATGEYSLLDGAIKVDELIKRASHLSMPAIALTDPTANLFGAIKLNPQISQIKKGNSYTIKFYQHCLLFGVKPIIGCEVYIALNKKCLTK